MQIYFYVSKSQILLCNREMSLKEQVKWLQSHAF